MSDGYYLTAQICRNGHVVTSVYEPGRPNTYFCEECGSEVLTKCEYCGINIRGSYIIPGFIGAGPSYYPPKYCYNCGSPYPWTERAIKAAIELAEEDENLSDDDAKEVGKSFSDVLTDGPQTKVAVVRIKRILSKAGKATSDAIKDIFIDVASEAAKKMLLGL